VYVADVPSLARLVPLSHASGWEDSAFSCTRDHAMNCQAFAGADVREATVKAQPAESLQAESISDVALAVSGNDIEGGSLVDKQVDDGFMEAVLRKKLEPPPLNPDGVVLFRLTRKAQHPMVDSILFDPSGVLADLHARVMLAGCEVKPSWSPLKALFVPCTEQQIPELADLGFDLVRNIHILALKSDFETMDAALRKHIPKAHRPNIREEFPRGVGPSTNLGMEHASDGSVEHTVPPSKDSCDYAQELDEPDDENDHGDDSGPMLSVEHAFRTDSSIGFPSWRPGGADTSSSP